MSTNESGTQGRLAALVPPPDDQQRFRDLFEAVSDWVWEIDRDGVIRYVSPGYEKKLGVPPLDVIGQRLFTLAGVDIAPEERKRIVALFRSRQAWRDLVYSYRLRNGKAIWVRIAAVPMFDGRGDFVGYRGTAIEITAQIAAEHALRASEQRFKQLFEAASDWFYETDTAGCITYISPNFQKIFGIASDIVGQRFADFPGVEFDLEKAKATTAAMKARRPFRDFVYARHFPSGEKRWLSASAVPMFDEDGLWRGYRGVVIDITERVRAEAWAQLAQRRLHDAVAHVRQPLVVYDADDRVVSFNQAFAALHRMPGGQTQVRQGITFGELADWQIASGFYAADEHAIDRDTLLARYRGGGEHTYHLGDGRWMLVGYRRLPDGDGVGLWSDVTEIKRAEEERRMLETRLHRSQRLEALGTLAGGIAHDLNNTLVPVLALTKVVAARVQEGTRERANLETVVKAAGRARDLVQQVLAFSRKEESGHELIDLAAVAKEALDLLRASVPSSIRLERAIAPVPPLEGDAGKLHQMIVNLVTNAAQAIGEGHGTIRVSLSAEGDGGHAHLAVADTGCGMTAETRARIFEPFFTTKDVGQGTGLGLAVVHGIVTSHGGRIEIESTPGAGSRFDIILPVQSAREGAAVAISAAKSPLPGQLGVPDLRHE